MNQFDWYKPRRNWTPDRGTLVRRRGVKSADRRENGAGMTEQFDLRALDSVQRVVVGKPLLRFRGAHFFDLTYRSPAFLRLRRATPSTVRV